MTYEFQVDECQPCMPKKFKINGKTASILDFGYNKDLKPSTSRRYGCYDSVFIPDVEKKAAAMEKYNLTEEEYTKLCDYLISKLHLEKCEWCL